MATYELYRNTAGQTVTLSLPEGSYVSSIIIKSPGYPDGEPYTELASNVVTIPFKHTMYDGDIEIEASFTVEGDAVQITTIVPVVTPLFLYSDLSEADRQSINNPSEDDVRQLESFIRHIIEAFTGQSFGYAYKTYSVDNPQRGLLFDVPLLQFVGISERYLTGSMTTLGSIPYEIADGGFSIHFDWNKYYHVKTDTFFLPSPRPIGYEVSGYFGYKSVPQDVREAARILLGMFNCDQTLWRDRYIENLRNADGSSIKYGEGAYFGTGSVSADQLLSKYVREEFSAAVI